MRAALAGAALAAALSIPARAEPQDGAFRPAYAPPAPGSYELPPIDRVADHRLLASDGGETSLFAAKGERIAIVGFVYRSCADANGCPLGMALLHRLDRELAADPGLAGEVALLTISFDPARDTPERMKKWRAAFAPRSPWRFLTGASEAELAPLLRDFDQAAVRLHDGDTGETTGLYRHVLKVFLVDRENRVRNVYSTGFLDPALVLNDVRTLLLEERRRAGTD